MTFQTSVLGPMAAGVVGELFKGSSWRVQPGVIDSDGVANPNEFGRVFTNTVGVDMHCKLGGVIAPGVGFFGILCNPKEHVLLGTAANGTLASSLALPQYSKASFAYDTTGLFVPFGNAGNVEDFVDYDTTTGLIYPRSSIATGGVGTIATASNVATVAALPGGSPAIGVGSNITLASGAITQVTSLGTGTGGNGTYNVLPTPDHAAQAFTYTAAIAAGRANIPGARVKFYNIPAAGLGVISLNNG